MTDSTLAYLPDACSGVRIDKGHEAGCAVQDAGRVNLAASHGNPTREFLKPPHRRVDDLLFVDGEAIGMLEAQRDARVARQAGKAVDVLPDEVPKALDGAIEIARDPSAAPGVCFRPSADAMHARLHSFSITKEPARVA